MNCVYFVRIHTSDNLFCSNSSPILELSLKFASQIFYETINKPLDGAYLADFGIDINHCLALAQQDHIPILYLLLQYDYYGSIYIACTSLFQVLKAPRELLGVLISVASKFQIYTYSPKATELSFPFANKVVRNEEFRKPCFPYYELCRLHVSFDSVTLYNFVINEHGKQVRC